MKYMDVPWPFSHPGQTSTQYGIFKTWMLTWHSGSLGKTSQTYGRALNILRGWAGMSLHIGLLIHDRALGKIVFAPGTRSCVKILGVISAALYKTTCSELNSRSSGYPDLSSG